MKEEVIKAIDRIANEYNFPRMAHDLLVKAVGDIPEDKYKVAASMVVHGGVGVKVMVDIDRELTTGESSHCSYFANHLSNKIYYNTERLNLKNQDNVANERKHILALFPESIYVKEIPNGYWPENYGNYYYPWFLVTTKIGHIKIGWRKRVIVIDWEQTDVKTKAAELFPEEDVTKQDQLIHAWGYEKAKEYLHKLLNQQ